MLRPISLTRLSASRLGVHEAITDISRTNKTEAYLAATTGGRATVKDRDLLNARLVWYSELGKSDTTVPVQLAVAATSAAEQGQLNLASTH